MWFAADFTAPHRLELGHLHLLLAAGLSLSIPTRLTGQEATVRCSLVSRSIFRETHFESSLRRNLPLLPPNAALPPGLPSLNRFHRFKDSMARKQPATSLSELNCVASSSPRNSIAWQVPPQKGVCCRHHTAHSTFYILLRGSTSACCNLTVAGLRPHFQRAPQECRIRRRSRPLARL